MFQMAPLVDAGLLTCDDDGFVDDGFAANPMMMVLQQIPSC